MLDMLIGALFVFGVPALLFWGIVRGGPQKAQEKAIKRERERRLIAEVRREIFRRAREMDQ